MGMKTRTKIKTKSAKQAKPIRLIISENNKITKAISVIFLVLIMFGLFAFIIIGLYRFQLIEFPPFIQNLFFKTSGGGSQKGNDDRNIYEFLQNNSESGTENNKGYSLDITSENIRDAISKTTLPDNLYLEIEANYYDGGSITRTENMSLWKKGDKYKYILNVNSKPEESYINDSKTELTENFITGDKSKKVANPNFSFDNIPHMPNINYYLNLLESGTIENQRIYQNKDSNIAHIKYSIPGLEQWELIDVSLDTGIVESVRCYTSEQNDLYYECTTTIKEAYYDGDERWTAQTSINDSMFEIK